MAEVSMPTKEMVKKTLDDIVDNWKVFFYGIVVGILLGVFLL